MHSPRYLPGALSNQNTHGSRALCECRLHAPWVLQVRAGWYHGTPVAVKKLHRKMLNKEYLELFKQVASPRHLSAPHLLTALFTLTPSLLAATAEPCTRLCVQQECELCLSLRHPNIVQLLGGAWQVGSPAVLMVMERCKCTLSDALLAHDTPLPWRARLSILIGVARAMSYLHAQDPPILHRDLKPENVRPPHRGRALTHSTGPPLD